MRPSSLIERAAAERRRAYALAHAAESLSERVPCRDSAGEQNRLREAAGHAAQRAAVLEAMTAGASQTPCHKSCCM
jgi:hypothetical protein